ncbi:hypothetical protein [Nostoc sp. CCY0012]|uniref:hypothetical protein n=1 Tax=Nostoc sp. CCY0012 TaxID=1056123 RepID=UPI0039C61AA9
MINKFNKNPFQSIRFPFYYLECIKRPGKNYFLKKIISEDFIILILGISFLSIQPIIHAVGVLFLLFSFWCIYEIGYYENDLIAENFEKAPVLSSTYKTYKNNFNIWTNWLWALLFAFIGVILLEINQIGQPISQIDRRHLLNMHTISLWLGLLVLVRIIFYVYNHVDKKTRVWIYPLLQTCKYFSFAVITSIDIVSVMLFASQIFASFINYFTYRFGEAGSWPESIPQQFIRLMFFSLLVLFTILKDGNIELLTNLQVIFILLFCAFKARHEMKLILQQFNFIYQDKV